jgi:hypothetical protein
MMSEKTALAFNKKCKGLGVKNALITVPEMKVWIWTLGTLSYGPDKSICPRFSGKGAMKT